MARTFSVTVSAISSTSTGMKAFLIFLVLGGIACAAPESTDTPRPLPTDALKRVPTKRDAKTPPVRLTIVSQGNLQIKLTSVVETDDTYEPTRGKMVVADFQNARVEDANGAKMYEGRVVVWFLDQPSPTVQSMLSRMLQPFTGRFQLETRGNYFEDASYATVHVESVTLVFLHPEP